MAWFGIKKAPLQSAEPMPVPLGPEQRRPAPWRDFPMFTWPPRVVYRAPPAPNANVMKRQFYDELISYNPIGAGVFNPYITEPNMMGKPGTYQKEALLFGIQQINFGRQPEPNSPLWPPGITAMMFGDLHAVMGMTPIEALGIGALAES